MASRPIRSTGYIALADAPSRRAPECPAEPRISKTEASSGPSRFYRRRKLSSRLLCTPSPVEPPAGSMAVRVRDWLTGMAEAIGRRRNAKACHRLSEQSIERACRRQGFAWLVEDGDGQKGQRVGRERRQLPRYIVAWPARCRDQSGAMWNALVRDHSRGGLGLEACPPLEVNRIIDVTIEPFGTFTCRVAWSDGERCGMAFIRLPDDLDVDDLELLSQVI